MAAQDRHRLYKPVEKISRLSITRRSQAAERNRDGVDLYTYRVLDNMFCVFSLFRERLPVERSFGARGLIQVALPRNSLSNLRSV